jgi:protocatechuate 3,4-dioxygenase beta subunit
MTESMRACRSWPEQDEGPYYRDIDLFRSDIVEDRVGVALHVGIRLVGADGVDGIHRAVVDVWHCDAFGRYSGFPPPDEESGPADRHNETFLRGRQRTDEAGRCEFRSIYPGWYPGRTPHVHVIARVNGRTFTSQLYFPESLTHAVFTRPPYNQRPDRDTTNAVDSLFAAGGNNSLLDVVAGDDRYLGTVCLMLGPHE